MLLFPKTDRSVMDLIFGVDSKQFDPLDENRFHTETRGLVSVQVAREKEIQKQLMIKKILFLVPVVAIVGYLVVKA